MQSEQEFDYGRVRDVSTYANARATFIRQTYAHLAVAVLAFIGLETLLVKTFDLKQIFGVLAVSPFSWLIVLLAFWGASALAQSWARSETSVGLQYLGLALYVVAEALICLPLVAMAAYFDEVKHQNNILQAGIVTLAMFVGLTCTVFVTKKDFSFLAPILSMGSWIALGIIVAGIIFGFTLGLFFCGAMIALISGFILYETSTILHHHRTDQPVAAALYLFSSIATLFWYVLRIVMILNNRD